MRAPRRPRLPLLPLLRAYTSAAPDADALDDLPHLGPRLAAIRAARAAFLHDAFLNDAPADEFATVIVRFYEACVRPPLHAPRLRRRAGLVRHALAYLLRSPESISRKAEQCLRPDGPYFVAGLGPSFWSALFQALAPDRHPGLTPTILTGLARLGLVRREPPVDPATVYAEALRAYDRLRQREPSLSAGQIDHFLTLVAFMEGRDLWSGRERLGGIGPGLDLPALVRQERVRVPLRRRLRERGRALDQARDELEAALATQDGPRLGGALSVADPVGARRAPLDWLAHAEELTLWVGRLWEADDPHDALHVFWSRGPIPGAGLWLGAAVLHLRDPRRFLPWGDDVRRAWGRLDDALTPGLAPLESYQLANEGLVALSESFRVHPLEVPALLTAVARTADRGRPEREDRDDRETGSASASARFRGFCTDTFAFLRELNTHNCREWMAGQRDRYRFAVRQPLVELCRALAERYVEPVLRQTHGWPLECGARSGQALTSVVKNDYGRSEPYNTVLWIAFCRKGAGGKRDDAQFFVRLDENGLTYGLRLGREAREAGRLLRRNVQEQAEPLFRALCASGAAADVRFAADGGTPLMLRGADDLRTWAAGKSLLAYKQLPPDHPLLASDELVGEVLLTFDRLLPAYACAVLADPLPILGDRSRPAARGESFGPADFVRATHLGESWLARARELLELKRQLILQGVPGTGKTHVARCLARLLTGGRDDAVRLVQFHPAYSYEEFVEGIKVKSVEVNGRSDVIYPVEDGLLCAFAAEAERRPSQPFVLIIDEINRGNLPRVFGELLYLLEYREQTVTLPYSRRAFRLPRNLYLLGTMNAADRSVALIDQALRRRFSFLEMPPDGSVLASWLREHPPADGPAFAAELLRLFEQLNDRLRRDLGPDRAVGHSYFMVEGLDEPRLRVVWEHQVRPLLEEHFAGQPGRLSAYALETLRDEARRAERRARRPAHSP